MNPSSHRPFRLPLSFQFLLALLVALPAMAQTDVLTIENDRVGINEDSPQYPLHVSGTSGEAAHVFVENTASPVANRTMFTLKNNGGPEFKLINSNSSQAWRFHIGSARFNVSLDGSGVDELQLKPGGDLVITGELTTATTTYPDYVFEDDYELMPLSELATYIDTNRHLPNVPTAEETGNGRQVNLSELQVKLLEKVEELTLYTLQQQEEIEQLREEVAKLSTERR